MQRRQFLGATAGLSLAQPTGAASQPAATNPAPANDAIRLAREAALAALRPTERQLRHGEQLHARALVFDAYGFSPRAGLDRETLRAAVDAGAADLEIQDLREDMGMTRCVTDAAEQAEFRQAWEASGVTCIFQNAGEEGQDPMRLIKRLARFTYVTDMLRDFVFKAATPEEIVRAKAQQKRCLYLTGNGVPLTQQWLSVTDELRYVRVFFELGIRMMHVTYQRRNMLGDGCGETANGGLSDFGRAAIAEMNRVGVIVDVAHSGWRTSLEAAQVSTKPMVASHTGCDAVNHHIRCKPDEVIRAIVDKGGLVGICCIAPFLGGGITAFLDHIDHVVRRFGPDHVAIGTDVGHASRSVQADRGVLTRRSRPRFSSLWPPGALVARPQDTLSLSWTNWPLFTVGMVQRGYPDRDIEKILGGNMLRVARAAVDGVR
jgi:membrane dipeptidase